MRTGTLAPLKNVVLFRGLVDRVTKRAAHLPGIGCFYGHSGFGKTFSAVSTANRTKAYCVEVGDTWTRRTLTDAIIRELGLTGQGSVGDRVALIVDRLQEDASRPLIIDEADYLVRKGMVDLVREIHDKSLVPVILIGEELLPQKLQGYERTHNRVLDWVAAQPCDFEDAQHLARLYAPGLAIADELLKALIKASDGRARRICVNLERIREEAMTQGRKAMDAKTWGERPFFTGEPPKRRAA
jgi:DNA transposition AAA+ family ATPase